MSFNLMDLEQYKPGVPRGVLLLVAGLMWLSVGVMLDGMAWSWLKGAQHDPAVIAALVGVLAGLLVHHFGFLKIVDKNLGRILPMEGKRCLFSFMPWKSYGLVALMISMGVLLRHSPVPKVYLSVLYLCMGTALILSSVRYLRYLVLVLTHRT